MQNRIREFLIEVVSRKSQIPLLNLCLGCWQGWNSVIFETRDFGSKETMSQVFMLKITSDSTPNVGSQWVKAEYWTQNVWIGLTRLWNPLPPPWKDSYNKWSHGEIVQQILSNVRFPLQYFSKDRLQVCPLLLSLFIAKRRCVSILPIDVLPAQPLWTEWLSYGRRKPNGSLGRTLKTWRVQYSLICCRC